MHRVGLEPVARHLVEEDAAEAAADDDRHRARRGVARVEQGERLARRLLGDPLGRAAVDQLEAAVAAERLEAGLDRAVAAGDDLGAEADAGAVVGGGEAVGVEDRDAPAALAVGGGDLRDSAPPGERAISSAARRSSALRSAGTSPGLVAISWSSGSGGADSGTGSVRSPESAAAAASAARKSSASPRPSTCAK